MICPNCGKEIANDAKFCRFCGTKQAVPLATQQPAPMPAFTQQPAPMPAFTQPTTPQPAPAASPEPAAAFDAFEKEETVILGDEPAADVFEKEETVILGDGPAFTPQPEPEVEEQPEPEVEEQSEAELAPEPAPAAAFDAFEKEETVILGDEPVADAFEKEETVMLGDEPAVEKAETVVLQDMNEFENEETVVLGGDDATSAPRAAAPAHTPTPAPAFGESKELHDYDAPDYYKIPVYKEESRYAKEIEYINHLRALKQLLDDGIITEGEFTRKKRDILGL